MNSYTNRIVAYIDILGFKEKIKKSIDNNDDEQINKGLNRIYQLKLNNDMAKRTGERDLGTEVSIFSDNAVISYPSEKDYLYEIILDIVEL